MIPFSPVMMTDDDGSISGRDEVFDIRCKTSTGDYKYHDQTQHHEMEMEMEMEREVRRQSDLAHR